MSKERELVFSNEVLINHFQFAKAKLSSEKYDEFINSLDVNKDWLFDTSAWHTAEFHNKFRISFEKYLSHITNPARESAIFLFDNKGLKRFVHLIGVLLTPVNLFKNLPKFVKTMNIYNTYKVININKNLFFSKVSYQQFYLNKELKDMNAYLCNCARGSIESVCKYLGYKIFDLHESKCVKKGDDYCQYEITWVRNSFWHMVVIWVLLAAVMQILLFYSPLNLLSKFIITFLLPTSIVSLLFYFKIRKNLLLAFDYQRQLLEEQKIKYAELQDFSARIIEYQQQINEAISLSTLGAHSFNLIHEIATPVNIITYCTAEMVKDLKAGATNKDKLLNLSSKAELGSERILKMIKFFRTVVKGINPNIVAIDVVASTRDCHELMFPILKKNDVEVEFKTDTEKFTIETYDGYIETIILNILQNGVNALMAKDNERKIYIDIYYKTPDELVLSLGNNGPAIPDSYVKKIWEKFETKPVNGNPGSGFGLYNVKKLVEKIGGEISVETGYNNGSDTKFLIKFTRNNKDSIYNKSKQETN